MPDPSTYPPIGALSRPLGTVLSDNVYEVIKAALMDHDIEPGERLGIDALARELDVSPTPIREALARLEAEHLVVKEPLRGYRVTHLLTLAETTELFELRLLIEPWATARAAQRIDDDMRLALSHELVRNLDPPHGERYDEYRNFAAHDQRFHRLIAHAAQNSRVVTALDGMHAHLHIFRLHYGLELGFTASEGHEKITAAILAGDPDAAAAAMTTHLNAAFERILPAFESTSTARDDLPVSNPFSPQGAQQ